MHVKFLNRKEKKKKKKTVTQPKEATKKTTKVAVSAYSGVYSKAKDCHTDPCEVTPNFWIGSAWADEKMLVKASVYVPLSSSDGYLWDTGWRGEIMYVPITDYKALPLDVLSKYAERIAKFITDGHSVAMHCVGGHGRTGYMASAVLWLLGVPQAAGYSDPVGWLREHYCKKAVESLTQLVSLEEFTGTELVGKYEEKTFPKLGFNKWGNFATTPTSTTKTSAAYTDSYDYNDDDPCYDCIHCDVVYSEIACEYNCELGYKTGQLCERFFAYASRWS